MDGSEMADRQNESPVDRLQRLYAELRAELVPQGYRIDPPRASDVASMTDDDVDEQIADIRERALRRGPQ